jgi:mRNA interferase MazF
METGDVVLASLSQADGGAKLRPVLLLCRLPGFGDWLACGISSQTRHLIAGFDEVIAAADADYTASGVKNESLIRLGFLATLPGRQIAGTLGAVSPGRLQRLRQNLSRHLQV